MSSFVAELTRRFDAGRGVRGGWRRLTAIGPDFAELFRATTVSYVAMAGETTFWTHGPAWTDTSVLLDCGGRLAEPSASQQTATVEYSLERSPPPRCC